MKPQSRPDRSGFTLIELLVVVAIILLLGALVFMGVGRATLAAHKAESINNIKQLSSISISDAGDNNGIFPDIHHGPLPFWFTWDWRDRNGITRAMAYSSANDCWNREGIDICSNPKLDLWEYTGGDESEGTSSLFSYVCLIGNPIWTDSGSFTEPDNWEQIEERVYNEIDQTVRWTPKRLGQEVAYPILWIDVTMEWNSRKIGNFMKKGRSPKPRGGHIGYLDGHVEWVQGEEMKSRFSKPGLNLYW